METNISTRENAIEWWILQTDEYKEMQFSEFIKTHYTPSTTFNTLSGREIEIIYSNLKLSENAIKAVINTNITPGKWEVKEVGTSIEIADKDGKHICRLFASNTKEQNANAQAIASLPDIMRENEELKARCETYKKDYDSMVKEVLRLSGENSELFSALNYLLSSYNADFELITGAKLNDTEAVKKAKLAITKATK